LRNVKYQSIYTDIDKYQYIVIEDDKKHLYIKNALVEFSPDERQDTLMKG